MPYETNVDLPEKVRNTLPDDAQTIYRQAYNRALKQYDNQYQAENLAWTAVKKYYEEKDGKWIKKDRFLANN